MPREPTPTESIETDPAPTDSTTTARDVQDRVADVTERTEPGRLEHDSADPSEPESEREQDGDSDSDRVTELERRVAELEAELDAVRGLLDGVEAVDERVERRASTALAKAEALEERVAPAETGLVRERLPDTGGDDPRQEAGSDRTGSARRDSQPDPDERSEGMGSRLRNGRNADRHTGTVDAPGGDARAPTGAARGRRPTVDAGATDEGSAGTGAISSVGSGAPNGDATDEDADRSLAARLRDAFR